MGVEDTAKKDILQIWPQSLRISTCFMMNREFRTYWVWWRKKFAFGCCVIMWLISLTAKQAFSPSLLSRVGTQFSLLARGGRYWVLRSWRGPSWSHTPLREETPEWDAHLLLYSASLNCAFTPQTARASKWPEVIHIQCELRRERRGAFWMMRASRRVEIG